jgi:hypothetical protein
LHARERGGGNASKEISERERGGAAMGVYVGVWAWMQTKSFE